MRPHHQPPQDNATDAGTSLSSKRVQTFILFEDLSTDQFHFFMSQSTLLDYKKTFTLRQSSIQQFLKRRETFIHDTNGLYGLVEDRADLFSSIILRMKSGVWEPKDHEISYARWIQNQHDRSLSTDNDEDTPSSQQKVPKRIKRPLKEKNQS